MAGEEEEQVSLNVWPADANAEFAALFSVFRVFETSHIKNISKAKKRKKKKSIFHNNKLF